MFYQVGKQKDADYKVNKIQYSYNDVKKIYEGLAGLIKTLDEKEVAANTSTTNHYLGYPNWNGRYIFKFLQEYLDDVCETVFSKHWKDITYKGEL